jgi:hypothetical protein
LLFVRKLDVDFVIPHFNYGGILTPIVYGGYIPAELEIPPTRPVMTQVPQW